VDLTASEFALALLSASIVGAVLPLYRRWSERGLHLFVAVAAGIFLGTIFLHLLPHLAGAGDEHEGPIAHVASEAGSLAPWVAAMVGLLLLFAIEKVWLPAIAGSSNANPHTVLWTATYVGLSLHAITAGFALSAVVGTSAASPQLVVSLLIHKATETFSLATVMRLAQLSSTRLLVFLGLFALIEPTGLLVGRNLLLHAPALDSLLTGFACGTFLYVAACDLLPEVFHGHDRPQLKLVAVVLGIGITAVSMPRLEALGKFLARVGAASVDVFLDFAPLLLLGLVFAGVVQLVLKRVKLARHLAGTDMKSVTLAALFGAPLPLCSCSVVPVALALRRSGASKGATSSFAIATPEVGVDSIAVSFVLLDPLLAVVRPIAAIVTAITSGAAVNWLVKSGRDVNVPAAAIERAELEAGCCGDEPETASRTQPSTLEHLEHDDHDHGHEHDVDHEHGIDHGHADHVHADHEHGADHEHEAPHERGDTNDASTRTRGPLAAILHYAFVEMLDDLAVSLLIGVLLSGAIVALVPSSVFASPIASGLPGMLLMFVIGIPLYVCALTSTPIAAALILKGLSPGTALVFLLAGPATNIATLVMFSKVLGRRAILVQMAAMFVTVLALGLFVDRLYPWLGLTPSAHVGEAMEHGAGWWSIAAGIVLALLLLASLVRTAWKRDLLSALRDEPTAADAVHTH
jgi:uncharacterized membrane protein YraQ (UPF0718 family)